VDWAAREKEMAVFDAADLAVDIAGQHERRDRYVPLAESGLGMDAGYAIQERLIALWEPLFGATASWKVGLTTKRMQEMCGIDQPIAGAVFGSRIHPSPAALDADAFVRLGVEAEMALRISSTPDPAELTAARMRDHVDAACAAFEIVDDRAADYTALDAVSLVADNSWNAGIVLGAPLPIADCPNLLDLQGALICNGAVIETGVSRDAGGDPLAIVAWLAGALAERGRVLEPGQWVMTGSVVRTQFPKPGDVLSFKLGDFPPAEARID
jgi:2-keto-4-pentenoate hydratase